MKNFRVKRVLRLDGIQRHFRLFRVMWERGEVGNPNGGYSAKLAVGVAPKLASYHRDATHDWLVIIFGLRVHYSRSYGGRFA